MKRMACLVFLMLILTASAQAAELPQELERAAPEAAEELLEGDLSGGTGFSQGVGNILDRLADQAGEVIRQRVKAAAAILLVVVLCGAVDGFARGKGGRIPAYGRGPVRDAAGGGEHGFPHGARKPDH